MTGTFISPYSRKLVTKRAEAQMLSTVLIQRGDLGETDPLTGVVGGIVNPTTIYSGKARVYPVSGAAVSIGDGMIDMRTTTISIPMSAPVPKRDDIVTITSDDLSDQDLDSRTFRITEVDGGGYIGAARRLTCTSFYPSRYWGEQ
jgi:hypothetical protein